MANRDDSATSVTVFWITSSDLSYNREDAFELTLRRSRREFLKASLRARSRRRLEGNT